VQSYGFFGKKRHKGAKKQFFFVTLHVE
jgi:hypothetical protein